MAQQAAEAWLAERPDGFEATYTGTLSPASEFAASLYNARSTGPSSFGIRFDRPIAPSDTAATLQAALGFACFERVVLPDLDAPEGWRVTGDFPVSSFADGDGGQTITVDSLEGGRLRWTVRARLYQISGVDEAAQAACPCGAPMPEGSYWSVRQDFYGTLHFDCEVAGLAPAPAAPTTAAPGAAGTTDSTSSSPEPEPSQADAAVPSKGEEGEAFSGELRSINLSSKSLCMYVYCA